ncbi:MAG: type I methionyl aminopeptidase [Buchnera aphidicola (Brevicoryne brassicae)]|uniref:Methionine aminopeptidase n=1 Tax=Buchnera aphidicola (Brevicoryne brassicae) TaxID=911343 RepID=A0AAJ5TXU3_9GAMM|nr:type I methionyl aminopeptidase [Buchnera aphidicola]QCI19800.1 type I methionyl aminopeptidase [Buchnera aphidicola (Brevicoryne brassicae)]WAI19175.1 MAG: type I methionyl aminopeptidase [Buchnera aphidicola (Brevicoryne brassicae)]
MSYIIKTKSEIKKMRTSGKLAAEVLEMIKKYLRPNISTEDINQICHDYIIYEKKAIPACLGYHGFPKSICTSINDVVCHGIPNKKKILKEGDIINIDITIIKDNYHGDTSKMFLIGKTSILSKRLCKIAQESLYLSLKLIRPGIPLYKIGEIIQNYVEKNNFSVVKEYCGHGIGRNFHEEPHILHYKNKENNILLKKGMIFTIEPMINAGNPQVRCMKDDGWTVKTKDRSLSAQYEHTVLVTDYGCDVLTRRNNEKISQKLFNKN